ncbi:hypothetical protein LWI29_031465 [Acer saccharum]|uniref:Uncharacterized protein n=1 Tax=Acer saccharum TaxID=4024 RepID=A0AA39W9C3_ACESA|nr:hypothetical protein LWI29_031465 [Acer saccharum]
MGIGQASQTLDEGCSGNLESINSEQLDMGSLDELIGEFMQLANQDTQEVVLKRMVDGAEAGDVLFFHCNGHGTRIPSMKPGRPFRQDEAIVFNRPLSHSTPSRLFPHNCSLLFNSKWLLVKILVKAAVEVLTIKQEIHSSSQL